MDRTFLVADNIITSLGFDTSSNYQSMLEGKIGIKEYCNEFNGDIPYYASMVDDVHLAKEAATLKHTESLTRFEKLVLLSISKAAALCTIDLASPETLFILSSTKGNVALLDPAHEGKYPDDRLYLWKTAQLAANYFGNPNSPLVISHACISGVTALITAKRYIRSGFYKHVVVCGADVLSRFIVTGFHSLKAVSPTYCAPYDAAHEGLNLGEGAATLILSSEPKSSKECIEITHGAVTNDANHISGPSRTGEGLFLAIQSVLQGRASQEFAFVNTHGTATVFNDDMEAIALTRAGLSQLPVSSLKGYIGHTMGAAGVIESVITAESLLQRKVPKTAGFSLLGTPEPIQVIQENFVSEQARAIKTASGFGGCNAAIVLERVPNPSN